MKRNSYVVPFSLSPLLPYWKKGIRHPDVFNNAVMSITHNDPNGAQIVKHSYNDSTNNIVEYLNSIDGNTEYNYDFLGQLISADHANQTDESYTYDANGNRIVANGSNYTTGDNNELTSDGNYTYTYDAEGNRTSKTNSAGTERELYTWDYRNRLTTVTKQTCDTTTATWTTVQIVEYTYDYNNIWIRKTVDTNGDGTADSKSIFIPEAYQAAVQLDDTDLTDSAGPTVTHHYLWTPNTQDKLLADTTTDGILWSLTDHLGTVRDILGTASTHLIYDAFGNLISGTNPLLFGYTGKAFDADTALQNNINRWYDVAIGRWLSTDPIGFEGNDTNLYRYVKNRILKFLDSWGLQDLLQWATNLPEIPEWLKELKIDFIINEVDCKCNSQGVSIQDENTSFQLGKNRAHFRYFENGRAIEIDYNAEQIMMQLIEEHLRIQLATDEGNVSASIQRNFAEGVTGARYEDGRLSGFYQQDAWMIEAMHDTTSNTTEVASKGPWGRLDMTYDPGYGTNVHIKGPYFEAGYSPNGMFGSGWFSLPGLQFGGGVDANGNLFTEAKVWKRFPNYMIEVGGSARKDCYQVDLLWQTKDPYDKTNKKRIELKNLIRKTQENFEISTGLNIFF